MKRINTIIESNTQPRGNNTLWIKPKEGGGKELKLGNDTIGSTEEDNINENPLVNNPYIYPTVRELIKLYGWPITIPTEAYNINNAVKVLWKIIKDLNYYEPMSVQFNFPCTLILTPTSGIYSCTVTYIPDGTTVTIKVQYVGSNSINAFWYNYSTSDGETVTSKHIQLN